MSDAKPIKISVMIELTFYGLSADRIGDGSKMLDSFQSPAILKIGIFHIANEFFLRPLLCSGPANSHLAVSGVYF